MKMWGGGAGLVQSWECLSPTNMAWVQFQPGVICGLSFLWLSSCSEGFSLDLRVFPPSWKTSISKFQRNQDRGLAWEPAEVDVACSVNIIIFFIIIIFSFNFLFFFRHNKCIKFMYWLCFKTLFRQLIYNYPEQLFADAGVMAIEHADFEGVERLALVLGMFHQPI